MKLNDFEEDVLKTIQHDLSLIEKDCVGTLKLFLQVIDKIKTHLCELERNVIWNSFKQNTPDISQYVHVLFKKQEGEDKEIKGVFKNLTNASKELKHFDKFDYYSTYDDPEKERELRKEYDSEWIESFEIEDS